MIAEQRMAVRWLECSGMRYLGQHDLAGHGTCGEGTALLERGVTPAHIRRGGELESQRKAEDRLLKLHDLAAFDSGSLFISERDVALRDALRLQAQEFAFRASPEAIEYF